MEKVDFKIEEGAAKPEFNEYKDLAISMFKILKIYKGDMEMSKGEVDKVAKGFEDRGFIKLRSNERILFSTGVSIKTPVDVEAIIEPINDLFLKRGIILKGDKSFYINGKINLVAINTTTFLPTINKGEFLAKIKLREVPEDILFNV